MKITKQRKMCAVEAPTAAAFQNAYNAAWEKLAKYEPTERWPQGVGHCVYLIYEETVKEPETAKEIYESKGEVFHCYRCPYLGKQKDMRVKHIPCAAGSTTANRTACDMFYNLLAKGEITPVEL